MNKAQLSLYVFGVYMIVAVGIGFMFTPMLILKIFNLTAGDDIWIRFVGMLGSIIGGYYLVAAKNGIYQMMKWSVPMRYYAAAFMVIIFLSGKLGASVLLFAFIDAAAATWTWSVLKSAR